MLAKKLKKEKHKNFAWNLLGKTLFNLQSPQLIYLEPTNDCGLNCSLCPNKHKNNTVGYLDLNLFKKIISELSQFKNLAQIILHKSGEPLLHPHLPQMVDAIKKSLPSVKASFSTNGLLLSARLARQLILAAPDEIYVSLGNLLNDSQKDKGKAKSGADVIQNIKYLLQLRKRWKKNKPEVILRFISQKSGFRIFDAKNTSWQGLADKIEVRPYHSWCGYLPQPYSLPSPRTPCFSLWTTLAINWDGTVSICSLDYANSGVIGNGKTCSLKSIWKGEELKLLRERHLAESYENLKPCKDCSEWRYNREFWTKENIKKAKSLL